jgi:hypothetical protein
MGENALSLGHTYPEQSGHSRTRSDSDCTLPTIRIALSLMLRAVAIAPGSVMIVSHHNPDAVPFLVSAQSRYRVISFDSFAIWFCMTANILARERVLISRPRAALR